MWYFTPDDSFIKKHYQLPGIYELLLKSTVCCVQVYSNLLWCLLDCLCQTYAQGSTLLHLACVSPEGGSTAYNEGKGTKTRLRNKNKARSRLALRYPRSDRKIPTFLGTLIAIILVVH